MNSINNAATLNAPEKLNKKFCFAVIPALFYTTILLLGMIANFITFGFDSVSAINIVSFLCWLAFSVFLFFRKNNIAAPIFLGVTLILPAFLNVVLNYSPSFIQIYSIFWRVVATALCVLFVLNTPEIKAFIKKTKYICISVVVLFIFSDLIFSIINNFESFELIGIQILAFSLSYLPIALTIVLLLLWLDDPYKKASPQAPAMQSYVQPPVQTQPMHFVQPPVQAQPMPFVQQPMQAQPPAQTDVADEIKKYKELLDSGIITPEEFESAKAKLLNKI